MAERKTLKILKFLNVVFEEKPFYYRMAEFWYRNMKHRLTIRTSQTGDYPFFLTANLYP